MPPRVAPLTSSNAAAGVVAAGGQSGAAVAVELAAGVSQVDAIFTPLAPASTIVEVTIPGFREVDGGARA